MSTWQIFPDATVNFRWEISDQQLQKEEQQCDVDSLRLPSMADLLLLGCSKLVENCEGNVENPPMFRTGSGKSVVVEQSSIAKARSVLGDIDDSLNETGPLDGRQDGYASLKPMFETDPVKPAVKLKCGLQSGPERVFNMSNSMFQTASGRTVNISSAGLLRAKTLLGLDENGDQESLYGSGQKLKQSSSTDFIARENPSCLEAKELSNLSFSSSTRAFTNADPKPPPFKFQTAGGRSISVSNDALQRARSLLGNPEFDFLDETSTGDPLFSVIDNGKPSSSSIQRNEFNTPFSHQRTENGAGFWRNFTSPPQGTENGASSWRNFTSPPQRTENGASSWRNFTSPRSISSQKQSYCKSEKLGQGNNLIAQFDAEAPMSNLKRPCNGLPCDRKLPKRHCYSEKVDKSENTVQLKINSAKRSVNGALVDISNTMNVVHSDKEYLGEKRRVRKISSVPPFKKPRTSFVTPLNKTNSSVNVLSRPAPKEPHRKQRVSMRYPVQVPRAYLKEYFVQPPSLKKEMKNLPEYVRKMNPIAAESYTFDSEVPADCIGPEAFYCMLSQSGASAQHMTKEWVSNHYKWIVWKLASYERCYPAKFAGKLLTVSNVLEELRYRYEKEVNHGHRSSIKRILDGDAPPSSMMVLCISSVGKKCQPKFANESVSLEEDGNNRASNIELTDGWYHVKARLDELLSQKLASGKLFLGQKLRIWGAKLCGWNGPVSPFEASQTVSILLHTNGTYRCHWAEQLGFCKSAGLPLAFRCIKGSGGAVPSTLVGVTRIYPVLYRERLSGGSFVVRSEREEAKALQLYNQRRDAVAEGIMSAFQREAEFNVGYDHESEEGARILKLLETAAEPDVLMAEMSYEQLTSIASYKAKLEAMRQSNMQKSIEEAVEAAGLSEREVTPFLRVRVVGLTSKCHPQESCPQKGLITIWNPTQKQTLELCEGQAYAVGGLVPSSSESGILYLQARGSTSKWLPLSPSIMENFARFFTPRSSTPISSIGEVPLYSEFDIAAFVVYVGEVYRQGHQHKQWVFVTDGSTFEFCSEKSLDSLLAINFCLPCIGHDSSAPVNSNIVGSVVGFCNLTKRPKDQVNGLWVAEATENSDYFLSYDHAGRNHLKGVSASVLKWAHTSSSVIEKLKERVLNIIRNSKPI